MATPGANMADRADEYCRRHGSSRYAVALGAGKDGGVWPTDRTTAVKIHERTESYRAERNAYTRFRDVGLTDVNGFAVPELVGYDDELLAIEMAIVSPPFVIDFASVVLDVDPELIEDEGHTLADLVRERFGEDRMAAVLDTSATS